MSNDQIAVLELLSDLMDTLPPQPAPADLDLDDDGNCEYCGQKCWEGAGEMCDEQQAGGFDK